VTLPRIDAGPTVEAPEGSAQRADTLVLALGNSLRGDDGAGPAVAERLSDLPIDAADVLDGGAAGLETILLLEGYRRAIIVDAADMGRAPGEWVRFRAEDVQLGAGDLGQIGILHGAGLAEALALGAALNMLPPEIVIYGIQPAEVGWSPGLSAPVAAAVAVVSDAIRAEVSD
jgi:hydrogenase maturation protease